MILRRLDRNRDIGLLILRIGLGLMFVLHGWPKLFGGPETWTKVGGAMSRFGIDFLPAFWGLAAACAEFFGGICLVLGILFRPACVLLAITMTVAATKHLSDGDGLLRASHAIEAGIVFLSLILIGPGRHSLDEKLGGARDLED